MKKIDGKHAVWVYAAVLFISAFIVLLVTAYSQIKFNKSIEYYKLQLSSEEKAKINYQTDLNSALNKNKEIDLQTKSLKDEFAKIQGEIDKNKKEVENANRKLDDSLSSYEALIKAEDDYDNGNIVECAVLLCNRCNSSTLKETGLQKYNFLADKTFIKASEILFNEGYKEYLKGNNISSINKFDLSLKLSQNQYFSDDCYFFMAYAYYNEGNNEMALRTINTMLKNYKDSSYKDDAEYLLRKLGG